MEITVRLPLLGDFTTCFWLHRWHASFYIKMSRLFIITSGVDSEDWAWDVELDRKNLGLYCYFGQFVFMADLWDKPASPTDFDGKCYGFHLFSSGLRYWHSHGWSYTRSALRQLRLGIHAPSETLDSFDGDASLAESTTDRKHVAGMQAGFEYLALYCGFTESRLLTFLNAPIAEQELAGVTKQSAEAVSEAVSWLIQQRLVKRLRRGMLGVTRKGRKVAMVFRDHYYQAFWRVQFAEDYRAKVREPMLLEQSAVVA
jgi:hypothetical protein